MSRLEFFDHMFNYSESLPAAGTDGKRISFKNCRQQFLKEILFP